MSLLHKTYIVINENNLVVNLKVTPPGSLPATFPQIAIAIQLSVYQRSLAVPRQQAMRLDDGTRPPPPNRYWAHFGACLSPCSYTHTLYEFGTPPALPLSGLFSMSRWGGCLFSLARSPARKSNWAHWLFWVYCLGYPIRHAARGARKIQWGTFPWAAEKQRSSRKHDSRSVIPLFNTVRNCPVWISCESAHDRAGVEAGFLVIAYSCGWIQSHNPT